MPRQVKLQDTGEKSTSDKAYKAPNGKYYSSQEAYDTIAIQNKYRIDCIDYLYDLLGYGDLPAPTILYKYLDEMKKCGYDAIYETILQNEEQITWALEHKSFNNEFNKIKYIMAILRNNVVDVYKEIKRNKEFERKAAKIIEFKDYNRGKDEDEDSYNIGGTSGKGKDVSSFLGDIE